MSTRAIVVSITPSAKILGEPRSIHINAVENYKPRRFFSIRRGLWLYEEFVLRIVSRVEEESVQNHPAQIIVSRDMYISAGDIDIIPELGEGNYNFGRSEVCAIIEQLILMQPGGISGALLHNGNNNIFYVAGYPIRVVWDNTRDDWDIRTWKFNSYWRAGDRVFSRI